MEKIVSMLLNFSLLCSNFQECKNYVSRLAQELLVTRGSITEFLIHAGCANQYEKANASLSNLLGFFFDARVYHKLIFTRGKVSHIEKLFQTELKQANGSQKFNTRQKFYLLIFDIII